MGFLGPFLFGFSSGQASIYLLFAMVSWGQTISLKSKKEDKNEHQMISTNDKNYANVNKYFCNVSRELPDTENN